MDKKWRKGLIYLLKVLYEIGAFTLIYYTLKYFAQSA